MIDLELAIDRHLAHAERALDRAAAKLGCSLPTSPAQSSRYVRAADAAIDALVSFGTYLRESFEQSMRDFTALLLRPQPCDVVGLDARDEDPHAIAPAGQLWEREAHRAADWEPEEVLCWATVGTENGNEEEPCELPLGHEGPHETSGAVSW